MEARSRFFGSIGLAAGLFLFSAAAAQAEGNFYANADTGNDGNGCTSAASPCLTIAGAKTKIVAQAEPQNSTLFLSGTFAEAISFANTEVTAPDVLDGLRITATNPNARPVINAAGNDVAIGLSKIHNAKIDHLEIANAKFYGIQLTGSSSELAKDAVIQDNYIHDIVSGDPASSVYGMHFSDVKNAQVKNNTIENIYVVGSGVPGYSYAFGINVNRALGMTISDNTISGVSVVDTASAASQSFSSYLYGISVASSNDITIRSNNVNNVTNTYTSTFDFTVFSSSVYGINISSTTSIVLSDNTIADLSDSATSTGANSSAYVYAYAIYIYNVQRDVLGDVGDNVIQGNAISGITGKSQAKTSYVYVYGIDSWYLDYAMMRNNAVSTLTANNTTTEDSAYAYTLIGGIYGPYDGVSNTIRNNSISGLFLNGNYSGATEQSTTNLYGIANINAQKQIIKKNTVQHLIPTINNNDKPDFYDYVVSYPIYMIDGMENTVANNIIDDIIHTYATAGVSGLSYQYVYGVYVNHVRESTVRKNTIKNSGLDVTLTAPTNDSSIYSYLYPLFLANSEDMTVSNNRIQQTTHVGNSGDGNNVYLITRGLYLQNLPNSMVQRNRFFQHSQSGTGTNPISSSFSGLYAEDVPHTTIQKNRFTNSTFATTSGINSQNRVYGMYFDTTTDTYINGNSMREYTVAGGETQEIYGIYFYRDVSGGRVFNNILIGDPGYEAEADTAAGIHLVDSSTERLHIVNNTLVDWVRPLTLAGGSQIKVLNNILSAVGANSYALAVGRDQMDNESLISNYNLLYNITVPSQLVYDSDNTLDINFGDWTNVGGSYGYDVKSINKNPKLNAQGFLRKGSKAINRGTKQWGYAANDPAKALLAEDVDGTSRPAKQGTKVDIGADEYAAANN